MAHGVIRTDNMLGTDVGTHLVSFKYQPSDTDTAIDNGNVVVIGDLINGEREVHTATTPAANSALAKIAVVASVEVIMIGCVAVSSVRYNRLGPAQQDIVIRVAFVSGCHSLYTSGSIAAAESNALGLPEY